MAVKQTSNRETMQCIVPLVRKIHSLCSSKNQYNGNPPPPSHINASMESKTGTIPPIDLPPPSDITQSLIDAGCPPATAQSLSHTFLQCAHLVRSKAESLYRETCQRWLSHQAADPNFPSLSGVAFVIEAQYQRQLRITEQMAFNRALPLSQHQKRIQQSRPKPAFNQEFVPLLEKYFEYNPYPSAADRSALARKSMMTPRQIEVWFQNHRNRAKKEGKVLQRNSRDMLPQHISLESLEKSMPFFVIPEAERRDPFSNKTPPKVDDESDDDEQTTAPQTAPLVTFSFTAPSHAFPTSYPPRCDYDPFPCKTTNYKFSPLTWPRRPATARPMSQPVDFEELIRDFTVKLNLREPASRKPRRRLDSNGRPAAPWFASRSTIAPSAPHPAFVRSPLPTPSPHFSPLPIVPAPLSCLHPFRSPSPCAPPPTSALLHTVTPIRRKVARLPKRTPKNASMSHRHDSPALSEISPGPSRLSSFGFDSSPPKIYSSLSSRRPSSSSGSSSSSSSTVVTPVLPHATLQSPAVSVADFDLEHLNELFEDSTGSIAPLGTIPSKHPFNLSQPSVSCLSVR